MDNVKLQPALRLVPNSNGGEMMDIYDIGSGRSLPIMNMKIEENGNGFPIATVELRVEARTPELFSDIKTVDEL